MGNKPNDVFHDVCLNLGMRDQDQIQRFHHYLDSIEYEGVSESQSFSQLKKTGREFLAFDGGLVKTRNIRRR